MAGRLSAKQTPRPNAFDARMETLQNKNVVIVGATGGIGRALVPLIQNSRANVYLTGRDQATLTELAATNKLPDGRTFVLDVTQHEDVLAKAAAIETATDGAGVDILINASGIGIIKPLEALTLPRLLALDRRQLERCL